MITTKKQATIIRIKCILYKHTEILSCGYSGIRCNENQSGDDNYTKVAKDIYKVIDSEVK